MSRSKKPSRRAFLRTATGAAMGIPLLRSLPAHAQLTPPKRLIIYYSPNGVPPLTWWPSSGATEYDFILGPAMQALAPHRDDLTFLGGVNLSSNGPGGPHARGMGALLTGMTLQMGTMASNNGQLAGWPDGMSVDQAIANAHAGSTLFPSLQVGVRADNYRVTNMSRLSYSGPAAPLPAENNPHNLWSTLFPNAQTPVLPPKPPPGPISQTPKTPADYRLSVLDTVKSQFDAMKTRVGSEDRVKLERHQDMVREVERRLESLIPPPAEEMPLPEPEEDPPMVDPPTGGCDSHPEPQVADVNSDGQSDFDHDQTVREVSALQRDLLVAAFRCDLTRIVTYQFGNAWGRFSYPFMGTTSQNHSLSHAGNSDATSQSYWTQVAAFHAAEIGALITALKNEPEGDGSIFDNTLIVWTSDVAVGNTHSHVNMPFLLAGSAGGAINTGRLIAYPGVYHNDLLVSLMNLMDVPGTVFGNPSLCTGGLTGLT